MTNDATNDPELSGFGGWQTEIRSPEHFLGVVGRLGMLQAERRIVWRGMRDASWRITTKLQRHVGESAPMKLVKESEQRLINEARKWGLGRRNGLIISDLQLLCELQHHGAPTHLLDVTSDLFTAAWFACHEQQSFAGRSQVREHPTVPGVVLAFDVEDSFGAQTDDFKSFHEGDLYLGSEASRETAWNTAASRPTLVNPGHRDARMESQRGLFLYGPPAQEPDVPRIRAFPFEMEVPADPQILEYLVEGGKRASHWRVPLLAIHIPDEHKGALLRILSGSFDRNYRTLFPDIDGFASWIAEHPAAILDGSE